MRAARYGSYRIVARGRAKVKECDRGARGDVGGHFKLGELVFPQKVRSISPNSASLTTTHSSFFFFSHHLIIIHHHHLLYVSSYLPFTDSTPYLKRLPLTTLSCNLLCGRCRPGYPNPGHGYDNFQSLAVVVHLSSLVLVSSSLSWTSVARQGWIL